MTHVDFILPIKTVAGLNARENWRARASRVKMERKSAHYLARDALARFPVIRLPVIVTMTRMSPGTLDSDNLQGAAKATRDGIADALGLDDADPSVTWNYAQEKCKRGDFGVRVRIEL